MRSDLMQSCLHPIAALRFAALAMTPCGWSQPFSFRVGWRLPAGGDYRVRLIADASRHQAVVMSIVMRRRRSPLALGPVWLTRGASRACWLGGLGGEPVRRRSLDRCHAGDCRRNRRRMCIRRCKSEPLGWRGEGPCRSTRSWGGGLACYSAATATEAGPESTKPL